MRLISDFFLLKCKGLMVLLKKIVEKWLHQVFQQHVYLLVELTLFLPVEIASVERAFFAMNLIKCLFCNKMEYMVK